MKKITTCVLMVLALLSSAFAQEADIPKFSGLLFGDYFYNINQKDSTKKDLNGIQIRRLYFTADYTVSRSFDARIRLEADQSSSSLTAGGRIGVMVKDAYLKWKSIFSGSDLIFGLSPNPEIEAADAFWGYRSIEKTITDLNGIIPSRDLSVDLRGKFNDKGTVKYWVKMGNNSGNAPEANKYKRFYGMLHFLPLNNFQFTIYGDYASYAPKNDPSVKLAKSNNAFIGAVMLNFYQKETYSAGLESFYKTQQNNFPANTSGSLQSQDGFGISAYAWFKVADKIRLIGRYDKYTPNADLDKNDRTNIILGAIDFQADKNVSIIPNIESVTYSGISAADLIARVTLYYQF